MRTALKVLPRAVPRTKIPSCTRCCSTSTTATTATETSAATDQLPKDARLRFAPSPTGSLHLGGLRTALFNHILARKWGGKWLLRVEDTDQSRLVPGSVDSLRSALEWAGLDYDEGVGRTGGSHGPYTQSERLDIYRHYAQELLDKGEAYECFCSVDDLVAIKTALVKSGNHNQGYDGRCRHLSRDDVQQRKRAGHKYTVRLKSRAQKEELPTDLIYGKAGSNSNSSGADDFILMKADGWPTYHLASVVDDHLMEISHVLRGEEWLPSVSRHHQLYKAFGWEPPKFAHLPLLINADGSKLSKRTGDVNVEQYIEKGYEPEALVNFLALMGWDHNTALEATLEAKGEGLPYHTRRDGHSLYEIFTMSQLIKAFDISLINHRSSAVDLSKLVFINKMTLRRKAGRLGDDGKFVNIGREADTAGDGGYDAVLKRYQDELRAREELAGSTLVEDAAYVRKVFEVELPRGELVKSMAANSSTFFLEPNYKGAEAEKFLDELRPKIYVDVLQLVISQIAALNETQKFDSDAVWDIVHATLAELKIRKKKDALLPMRHALSGTHAGPGVPQMAEVLGKARTLARLRAGLAYVVARARSTGVV